jgi:hypothetical protein
MCGCWGENQTAVLIENGAHGEVNSHLAPTDVDLQAIEREASADAPYMPQGEWAESWAEASRRRNVTFV